MKSCWVMVDKKYSKTVFVGNRKKKNQGCRKAESRKCDLPHYVSSLSGRVGFFPLCLLNELT